MSNLDYEFDGKNIVRVNSDQTTSSIGYVLEPLKPAPQAPQNSTQPLVDQALVMKLRQDLLDLKSTLFTIQEQCFQANRMLAKMDEKIK